MVEDKTLLSAESLKKKSEAILRRTSSMGQKEQADTLETECPLGETGRPLIKAREAESATSGRENSSFRIGTQV